MLEPRNKPFVFAITFSLSLSLSISLYLAFYYSVNLYMLDILVCIIDILAWDCLLTLVFNQESQHGTSTHSRGI